MPTAARGRGVRAFVPGLPCVLDFGERGGGRPPDTLHEKRSRAVASPASHSTPSRQRVPAKGLAVTRVKQIAASVNGSAAANLRGCICRRADWSRSSSSASASRGHSDNEARGFEEAAPRARFPGGRELRREFSASRASFRWRCVRIANPLIHQCPDRSRTFLARGPAPRLCFASSSTARFSPSRSELAGLGRWPLRMPPPPSVRTFCGSCLTTTRRTRLARMVVDSRH